MLSKSNDKVIFGYKGKEYELTSHPYEPCTYIRKDGMIIRVLHNGFDVYDLPERFEAGETLTGIDGKEYDEEQFCAVLKAALDSSRYEMDWPFAASLINKSEEEN